MKKKTYENPESELISVRFEEKFLNGSVVGGAKNVETATEDEDWGEF